MSETSTHKDRTPDSASVGSDSVGRKNVARDVLDDVTALILVDVQKGILVMPPSEVADALVAASSRLADAFHDAGLPVVWVHATGLPAGRVERPIPEGELPEWFADLDDRLPVHEGDHHVYKQRTWSAFPGTDLQQHLESQGVTQVVVAGIATGAGVESTARGAYDAGFTVTFVVDACVDGNPARHDAAIADDFPAMGLVSDVDTVVEQLRARWQV